MLERLRLCTTFGTVRTSRMCDDGRVPVLGLRLLATAQGTAKGAEKVLVALLRSVRVAVTLRSRGTLVTSVQGLMASQVVEPRYCSP